MTEARVLPDASSSSFLGAAATFLVYIVLYPVLWLLWLLYIVLLKPIWVIFKLVILPFVGTGQFLLAVVGLPFRIFLKFEVCASPFPVSCQVDAFQY